MFVLLRIGEDSGANRNVNEWTCPPTGTLNSSVFCSKIDRVELDSGSVYKRVGFEHDFKVLDEHKLIFEKLGSIVREQDRKVYS